MSVASGPSNRTPADVMQAMVSMFSTGDVSEVASVVHDDYFDHQGLQGTPIVGPDGFASVVAAARSGYESLEVSIDDLIGGADRTAARLRWVGVRPGGQTEERQTIEIVRVEDGRAAEHWGAHS